MNKPSTNSEIFIQNEFLSSHLCAELTIELDRSVTFPAGVAKTESRVDMEMRRANRVEVAEPTYNKLSSELEKIRSLLSNHFQVQLSGFERPQFLIYKPGDFYRKHADSTTRPDAPQYIKLRKISVVIFLNNQTDEPAPVSYTGGSLVVYVHPNALRIRGEAGSLVAFESDLPHEVEIIRSGARYSVVGWFF